MSPKPWEEFRVGNPSSNPNWTNPDCQELRTVSHVTHIPTARRIMEDGSLRADLVFDESKLNTERIRVVWLSPNDWTSAGGFRYGNVRFQYDWKSLVQGKKYYWVESIAYGITACRVLVTTKDYSRMLEPYDPCAGDGPWWLDSKGNHHWNGKHCLEIMFEEDIRLAEAHKVDFVDHHPRFCNIDHKPCEYKGKSVTMAGPAFLALLGSQKFSLSLDALREPTSGIQGPNSAFKAAFVGLDLTIRYLTVISTWGSLASTDQSAPLIARAVLHSLSPPSNLNDAAVLAGLFKDRDELLLAIAALLDTALTMPPSSGFCALLR